VRVFLYSINPLESSNPWFTKIPAVQTVFIACLMAVLVGLGIRQRKNLLKRIDGLLLIFFVIAWLFPLLLGRMDNLYRPEATLMPAAILMPRLPVWVRLCVLAMCLYLAYWICVLFYSGGLI
jgi:hypothetical protein